MTLIASIQGTFKMILMIIGGFVLLRFIGQLLIVKRNLADQKRHEDFQKELEKQQSFYKKNIGKINILGKKQSTNIQDVDYEEV
ncbi:MAG: hypothetical protein RL728_646 [Bacteroidota bacterium]|jgi:hypothetical protein